MTAKVRWIPSPVASRYAAANNGSGSGVDEGRARWIHCTPLLGHNGAVGVWMVVLIDEDGTEPLRRKLKMAPPVAQHISSSGSPGAKARGPMSVSSSEADGERRVSSPFMEDMQRSSGRARPVSGSARSPAGAAAQYGRAGAFAEWEKGRADGGLDGEGSLNSFSLH